MDDGNIILLILITAHLTIASYFVNRVVKSTLFTKKQKIINGLLVVMLPFVWCVLVYYLTKPDPEYDPELKRKPSEHYYESNKTIGGGEHLGHY